GTNTFRQPINGGSVTNLNFSVVPGASQSPIAQFLTFTNSMSSDSFQLGYLASLINSTALYGNIYTELNATTNIYNSNLASGNGALQQSNLLAACADFSSDECKTLLAKYGSEDSPSENITKLISHEINKDKTIKENDQFVPTYCSI
ncbi:MAG: hypothetical protein ABI370_12720, partial [Gammaproteobacteria bacterium]